MEGSRHGDPQEWVWAVLDRLPFPLLLIEQGSGRVLSTNQAGGGVPVEPTAAEDGVPGGCYATDDDGGRVPEAELPHRRAARGERFEGLPITWHTPDGPRSYLAFCEPLPPLSGGPSVSVLTYLDVTRLKATEAELRQAVRSRDEFFSVATHELKDPLSSLLLAVELLQRTAARFGVVPPDVLTEQLRVSKRQGERLAGMIENLLDVSRIATNRGALNLEAFNLCDLVGEVAERYREQARSTGSALDTECRGPVLGYWDRTRLEHAVSNLVSNALKYGAGRPIVIRVRADEETAWVEVEDHGIGIATADHGRIFERYERAADVHTKESLGLGLFIVRSIAEAHGGGVTVRSAPGQGATFTLTLPRKRLPRRDPAAREYEQAV